MYKYNCRKCPVRSRCIGESDTSPSTKTMIRRSFDARTDTLSTWGVLQKNCLLIKAEEERSASALSNRMKQARTTKKQQIIKTASQEYAKSRQTSKPKKSVIRRIRPQTSTGKPGTASLKSNRQPDYLRPVAKAKPKIPTRPLRRLASSRKPSDRDALGFYWLTIGSSGRHISLPVIGELALGRFDPNVGVPPDVDLTFEDQGINLISRRHARIIGEDGGHIVEDLGSRDGVFLNETQILNGPSPQLAAGDRIQLGSIEFQYDKIPGYILEAAKTDQVKHIFTITPTGRKLSVLPGDDLTIGHADAQVNFFPEIDLSQDGDAARRVSRRHALIHWKNGQPHLEDLGSGFGTRLDGEVLPLGMSIPLKPGNHIWLAGCVLAYDIEM